MSEQQAAGPRQVFTSEDVQVSEFLAAAKKLFMVGVNLRRDELQQSFFHINISALTIVGNNKLPEKMFILEYESTFPRLQAFMHMKLSIREYTPDDDWNVSMFLNTLGFSKRLPGLRDFRGTYNGQRLSSHQPILLPEYTLMFRLFEEWWLKQKNMPSGFGREYPYFHIATERLGRFIECRTSGWFDFTIG